MGRVNNSPFLFSMLSLGKNKRLKSKKDIELLLKNGSKIKDGAIILIYRPSENSPTKMAVSVQKKLFKNATDRNKIKRLIREAYRLNQDLIATDKAYHLFFIYVGKEIEGFDYFNKKIKQLLIRLNSNSKNDEQKN